MGVSYRPSLKPGIVPLRPLSLGEMLDGAIQALRQNPRGLMGSAAAVTLGVGLLSMVLLIPVATMVFGAMARSTTSTPPVEVLVGVAAVYLMLFLLFIVSQALLTGMLTTGVGQAVMGRTMSVAQLWSAVKPRLAAIVGASLLVGLAQVSVLVVSLLLIGAGFAMGEVVGVLVALLAVMLTVAAALFVYARLSLTIPALVMESLSPTAAMRRSWQLTRPSFWRVLGILILTGIIAGVLGVAIQFPFNLAAQLSGFSGFGTNPVATEVGTGTIIAGLVLSALGSIVCAMLIYPFLAAVTTLLYLDLRMRQEGLDASLNEQAYAEQHQAAGPSATGPLPGAAAGPEHPEHQGPDPFRKP